MAIPSKDLRLIYQRSGNRCAFDECGSLLTSPLGDGDEVVLGHVAHIIGQSRHGPRGENELPEPDRDRYANLVLLCSKHHKLVDSSPESFTAARLRTMKVRHEAQVQQVLEYRTGVAAASPPGVTEIVHSNLLSVTHVPRFVYSAATVATEGEVRERARWPTGGTFSPFAVRAGRLYAFADPGLRSGPFFALVDGLSVQRDELAIWWHDQDRVNWFVAMFNRCLVRHCRLRGLSFDHTRHRYFFEPEDGPNPRTVGYQPLNQKWAERKVVYRPRSKRYGTELSFWVHSALSLRAVGTGPGEFVLSLQPDLRITRDGYEELPPDQIGEHVTRRKARWFNYETLGHVQFWRNYLCAGRPRIVFAFSPEQRIVIDSTLMSTTVTWPGIPEEHARRFSRTSYAHDLFTWAEDRGLDLATDDEGDPEADGDAEDVAFEGEL